MCNETLGSFQVDKHLKLEVWKWTSKTNWQGRCFPRHRRWLLAQQPYGGTGASTSQCSELSELRQLLQFKLLKLLKVKRMTCFTDLHSLFVFFNVGHSKPAVEDYAEGAEVRMGNHRFICLGALGRGSYGEVWRAKAPSHGASWAIAISTHRVCTCQTGWWCVVRFCSPIVEFEMQFVGICWLYLDNFIQTVNTKVYSLLSVHLTHGYILLHI